MNLTATRLAEGLTLDTYMGQMAENRETFAANVAAADISPEVCARVRAAVQPRNILVLTEDWCSDSLVYLPILVRLAACAETWTVRVFPRDRHPDLADQYRLDSTRSAIPVVVVFDAGMRERGRFVERPALANAERQVVIDAAAATDPRIQAGLPAIAQSEAAREALTPALRALRAARLPAWQAAFVAELLAASGD